MNQFVDTILILALLSVLSAFGASRIPSLIKIVAFSFDNSQASTPGD